MTRNRLLAALFCATTLISAPAFADDGPLFSAALQAADSGDWSTAIGKADASGAVAGAVLRWRYLREQTGAFGDYVDFVRRHPDWPGLKLLRRKAENTLSPGLSPTLVVEFFAPQLPQTGKGSLTLAEAYRALGDEAAAEREIIRGWRELTLTEEEQAAILQAYGATLAAHHDGRMAAMLRLGAVSDAKRMLPLVSANTKGVAVARIALQEDGKGLDQLIKAVPERMAASGGLAYDRFRWRISKDKYVDAGTLLLERSVSAESLGDPAQWADWRRRLARKEMREGDARRAYKMAANHFLDGGDDYADLEWLAGYIALRKLDDPSRALQHFARHQAAVNGPISLARSGYWQGRAYEAMGQTDQAAAAYGQAARYQTAFYGLLAAEKLGMPLDPALAGGEAYPDWQQASFAGSSVFAAGRLLMAAGDERRAAQFFSHLAESLSGTEIGALAGMALQADQPYIGLVMAKAAADKGVIWPSAYFPLVGLDHLDLPVPTELTLSIARRESEFYPRAQSGAGALGLMQVMPETGKMMAAKVGVKYDRAKLGSSFDYNARLGSAYLAGLLDEFGSSPLLVAAGYNAGPGRSRKWMAAFGDPRRDGVDPIDWIEAIPFQETQTYVMRVAESLPIYRARLHGKTGPTGFFALLKGR
ncbi:MAG: lytic transglycosylase domain-containing protein [Paracoccaceae bacterium]